MFNILVFGANSEHVPEELRSLASSVECVGYDSEKLMEPSGLPPHLILCYPHSGEMSTLEIAQTLRMSYPELSLFFITNDKKDFDKKRLVKNGFTQAYLLPWEKSDLLRSLKEESIYSVVPELRDYQVIKVVDLTPGTVLDFSLKVFLPRNNKLVQFSHEGDPISDEKFGKLYENHLNTLFIHKDELEKFRKYTAETFKKLLVPGRVSETDKQMKLEKYVRELISDMFYEDTKEDTFTKSQTLLNEVKEIIKLILSESDTDIMRKMGSLVNQEGNFYLHLSNVSAYAGLFAIILGFEKPEEMALAGLLHDIGKINLPIEIADLEESEMSPHALEAYKKHPTFSIDIARLKRISLPDSVIKAILQHHEAFNGTGYPAGISSTKISKEGKLLAIADAFDYKTTMHPGRPPTSMGQAMKDLLEENSGDPGKMILDREMLKKLRDFLVK